LSPGETNAIQTYDIGSVWLVNWRTGGRDEILPLADEVQSMATRPTTAGVRFFVGADQEGGTIQRIKGTGFAAIPSALDQGRLDPTLLQADASVWGSELAAAGVNLDLAPVTDVVPPGTDAANEPIGALQREFGHDPATVGGHAAAVVRGMARSGVAATLKHFPGLGRVVGNTDTAAGVTDAATTATDPYLEAFRTAVSARPAMVMVSLATYRLIDPNHQAVFSQTIIGGLLRGKLGFDGVVVSDDLGMATAVASIPAGQRAVDFVAAGGDLITVRGADNAVEMAAALLTRAGADGAFRALVAGAALRVLRAKAAYGLLSCPS
jgi:beta-N-acetylhexosaminidase